MSSSGTDFKMNARFCAQTDAQGNCTQFRQFIEVAATQQALLGCAAFLGYVPSSDLERPPFQGITKTREACASSLKSALTVAVPPGTTLGAGQDPLATQGMTLINNQNGYVFMISIHALNASNPCFQVAGVKVQNAAFESPLTSQVTAGFFDFFVSDTAAGASDSGEVSRGKCFPYA